MKGRALEAPAPRRCAIYTRKSTSAGLDQAFNSLDAQREACEAYIARQPGWVPVSRSYDDGGFTGANLERPAFQALLRDVEAGLIDVVVVYKVDRLSRSLLDFAQVVERFNRRGAAFVSVTQNFSTADAMGRLTLNMLMSFAEFEREMIGERTRDKIGAARRKGKWTGGMVPLGYDVVDKKLIANHGEANLVRDLFQRYLEKNSAAGVAQWLNDAGVPLKNQVRERLRPWTKDLVLRVLRSHLYIGLIHHCGEFFPGEHPALVDPEIFEQVQARLDPKVRTTQPIVHNPGYLVRGTLRCGSCGSVMTSASCNRDGKVYRYYRCVTRIKQGSGACTTRQLPAEAIEDFVVEQLREALRQGLLTTEKVQVRLAHVTAQQTVLAAECQALVEQDLAKDPDASLRLEEVELAMGRTKEDVAELIWLAATLADFEGLWEVLTPANRHRLIRILVNQVVVDEAGGQVRVHLTDFSSAA